MRVFNCMTSMDRSLRTTSFLSYSSSMSVGKQERKQSLQSQLVTEGGLSARSKTQPLRGGQNSSCRRSHCSDGKVTNFLERAARVMVCSSRRSIQTPGYHRRKDKIRPCDLSNKNKTRCKLKEVYENTDVRLMILPLYHR